MFDPRDLSDSRQRVTVDPLRVARREKVADTRRRNNDPRRERIDMGERNERAMADVGMYRAVAYRDLSDAHFGGHPYVTRRALDRMVRSGKVTEHRTTGPKGGTWTALTLTERGAKEARQHAVKYGMDAGQQTHAGIAKRGELSHDTAIYRAGRAESARIAEAGGVVRRIRIDAELKSRIAQATEKARAREGKEAADAARFRMAEELGLPVKDGKVLYPDAQLEYDDAEGRTGRCNIEVATGHYRAAEIAAKAAAGFQMHGNGPGAGRAIGRAMGGGRGSDRDSSRRGGGLGRDPASIEL